MKIVSSDFPFARHSLHPPLTRPAMLNALATAGIVIAVMSFVASLISAAYGAGVYLSSTAARDRLLRSAPAELPVSQPSQPVLLTVPIITPIGPQGLEPNQRAAIVEVIATRVEMTAAQARQLDALLAADGGGIFAIGRDQAVAPQAILDTITDHFGRLPATADGAEPFFFETPSGRAEVYETRALFYAHDRLAPVRATAGRRLNGRGHPILLAQDVNALVRLAQDACGRGAGGQTSMLGDPQVNTLRTLLGDPQQQLVALVLADGGEAIGLNGASVRPDGYATVDFGGGALLLGPDGNVILRSNLAAIPTASGAACLMVVIEGLASAGLAGFLLVVAIRLLRNPRQRLTRFVRWAVMKIAVAAVGGAALGWMTFSYLSTSTTVHVPAAGIGATAAALAIGVVLAGVAFPVVLLIVSRTRRVREYYDPTA